MSARLQHATRFLFDSPGVPAGFAALVVVLIWSADDGASDPLVWVPGSLLLVGLLAVVVLSAPGGIPGGRVGLVAIGAFACFTAWCFLSIAWASVKADAWAGANKTLAYFAVYTLFAVRPWRARPAALWLGSYSAGVAAIGIWKLMAINRGGHDPVLSFIDGRFVEPISYANGNCALFLAASLPALFLASRRETPLALRGIFLASVAVLAELALLCQSRMSVFAAPVVLLGYFVVTPGRLRSLVTVLLAGIAIGLSAGSLLAVHAALGGSRAIPPAIDDAQHAVTLTAVGLLLAGTAWGLLDGYVVVPARVVRAIGALVLVLVVAGGVAGSALFVSRYGDPVHRAGIWWGRFKANEYVSASSTPHLTSGFGGAGRYQIWTVAVHVFERHPLIGIGVDNFAVDWLRERPNAQDNIYPHSVELRTLQQTGLVGALFAVVFLGAALTAAVRGWRKLTPVARGTSISALLVFSYWSVHGTVDWLWEIPALSAAAFATLGLAVALSPGEARVPRRWLAASAAVALAAFAVVTLVPPYLSARETEIALSLPSGSNAQFASLGRARRLNPFTSEPDVLGAVIASQHGDNTRQRMLLDRAIARNRYDWFPHLELGLLDAREGDKAAALTSIGQAVALDPNEQSIQFAAERVRSGRPPTVTAMDALYAGTARTCCLP